MGYGLGGIFDAIGKGEDQATAYKDGREDRAYALEQRDNARSDREFSNPLKRKALTRADQAGDIGLESAQDKRTAELHKGMYMDAVGGFSVDAVKKWNQLNPDLPATNIQMAKGKGGKNLLMVMGQDGRPLTHPQQGPAIFDADALGHMYNPPEKGTFNSNKFGIFNTKTGANSPHDANNPGVLNDATSGAGGSEAFKVESQFAALAKSYWGSGLGDKWALGADAPYAAETAQLASKMYFQLPAAQRGGNMNKIYEKAFEQVKAKKSRDEYSGEVPGTPTFGAGVPLIGGRNNEQTLQTVNFMKQQFPEGDRNPQDMRNFMTSKGIPAEEQQGIIDQVVNGPAAAVPGAQPAPVVNLDTRTKNVLNQAKIAITQKNKDPAAVKQRLLKMGITEQQIQSYGL